MIEKKEEVGPIKKYEKPFARDLGDVLLNANGACGIGNSFVGKLGNCKNGPLASLGNCHSGGTAGGKCRTFGTGVS
jgi:hypothetical protein